MNELPVGWGSRTNGTDPALSIKAERPGDWRMDDMRSKYSRMEGDDADSSDLPFGFDKRNNSKTIEELSLSSNATNVAVAETVLKGEGHSRYGGELGYIKPVDQSSIMGKGSSNSLPNGATLASVGLGDMAVPQAGADPTVLMLASVVVQMDGRMREMERTLAEMSAKQDRILDALSRK